MVSKQSKYSLFLGILLFIPWMGCTQTDPNIEMVFVKGGSFSMGCTTEQIDCGDDELPVHTVTLSDFYMSKYEVTQKLWREVMGSDPPELYNKGCDDCPVESVSWDDAQKFTRVLSAQTGKNFRLPTEAQWEYAARGGQKSQNYLYAGSNNIEEVAWYGGNFQSSKYGAEGTTHPVGQKKPNELGLYDMSGNVLEWCEDIKEAAFYSKPEAVEMNPVNNTSSPHSEIYRAIRGGSWSFREGICQVALRLDFPPDDNNKYIGFRVVLLP